MLLGKLVNLEAKNMTVAIFALKLLPQSHLLSAIYLQSSIALLIVGYFRFRSCAYS
jgi:hypothetical protein